MIMIKNNLKLLLRCKAIVLIVIIMVVITGLLSSVFEDMMNTDFEIKKCNTAISFSQNCRYEGAKNIIENVLGENDIIAVFYENANANKLISDKVADVVVEITDDECKVYSDEDFKNESTFVKMIIYSIMSNTSVMQTGNYTNQYEIDINPMPDSKLYYTIAYTVYLIWCAMIVLGIIIASERKNKIGLKYKSTPVSSFEIYLSRFIPTSIVVTMLIGISVAICTPLYSISWQSPLMSSLIILLGCIASSAVGTVIFSFIKNVIASIAVIFSIVMYWGFFGGAFASYIISSYADGLRDTSPIYFMIRSLVELNTIGQSDYTSTAVLVLCAIITVCIPLGMIAVKVGKEK